MIKKILTCIVVICSLLVLTFSLSACVDLTTGPDKDFTMAETKLIIDSAFKDLNIEDYPSYSIEIISIRQTLDKTEILCTDTTVYSYSSNNFYRYSNGTTLYDSYESLVYLDCSNALCYEYNELVNFETGLVTDLYIKKAYSVIEDEVEEAKGDMIAILTDYAEVRHSLNYDGLQVSERRNNVVTFKFTALEEVPEDYEGYTEDVTIIITGKDITIKTSEYWDNEFTDITIHITNIYSDLPTSIVLADFAIV